MKASEAQAMELPRSPEDERVIVAAGLMGAMDRLVEELDVHDLSSESLQHLFRAEREVFQRGEQVNFTTVREALRKRGLDHEKLIGLLGEVADEISTTAAIEAHIRIVREYSLRRQILSACENARARALRGDPAEVLADLQAGLEALRDNRAGSGPVARWHFQKAGDLEVRKPDYLVKGFLEKDTDVSIFGLPGSGKTFLALDLVGCVSTGKDFHGMPVSQGPALFVAGEGKGGIIRRKRAWEIRWQTSLKDAPLYFSSSRAAFLDPATTRAVYAAAEDVAILEGGIALVVIDTLAKNFGPGNESETSDMNAYLAAIDHFRERYGATVISIHHPGLSDKTRGRGNSALQGGVDYEFSVDQDHDRVVRLECRKIRDGEFPDPMAFLMRSVELDIEDEDGHPVTSAILDDTEFGPRQGSGTKGLGKWQKAALDTLKRLEELQATNLQESGLDPSTARVLEDDWREACYQAGANRNQFYRAKTSLSEKGKIQVDHGYVSSRWT